MVVAVVVVVVAVRFRSQSPTKIANRRPLKRPRRAHPKQTHLRGAHPNQPLPLKVYRGVGAQRMMECHHHCVKRVG